jgi:fused signal recognition particle receptor
VTKLDGTAKGGVIIGIADQFKIPIRYIGVGEKAADLRAFEGADFMRGLLGT